MTYFDAQTEIRRENEEAKAPVDSMVILDHLAYLAYHLYTLDALSRCTYPLRWGVLRADLRAEFMERAAIAYRMWHDSECESRADWEVLEKLEADTLRFMVVDLQSGIERMDVAQRTEREEWRSLEKQYAKAIRDLQAEAERLRGIENQAHEEGVIAGKQIAWLEFEIERLEEELKEQKRAAWNHERVSRDYLLAMKKVKSQGEQIDALTRQRDILADYVRERADRCGHCDNCWSRCYINQAKQALAAAGMEEK